MAKGVFRSFFLCCILQPGPLSVVPVSYPAKIIILLVITKSAHLARMIPRKRRISLVYAIRIYSEREWTASDLQSICNYSWNAQMLYSAYIVNLVSFESALFASRAFVCFKSLYLSFRELACQRIIIAFLFSSSATVKQDKWKGDCAK